MPDKLVCCLCGATGRRAYRPVPSPRHKDDMICNLCDTTDWSINLESESSSRSGANKARPTDMPNRVGSKGRRQRKSPRAN
jgi:hypothetical protein